MSAPVLALGPVMAAGVACAVIGVGLVLAHRVLAAWPNAGDVARALIVTGVALAVTDVAIAHAQQWAVWLSGFGVCAALHRWLEAFSPAAPAPSLASSVRPLSLNKTKSEAP